jgi:capsular polysaccharide biosynthesis protein
MVHNMLLNETSEQLFQAKIFNHDQHLPFSGCQLVVNKNAILSHLGDLVYDANGYLVEQELGTGYKIYHGTGTRSAKTNPKKIENSDSIPNINETALNLNIMWSGSHYHFLIELISRLIFISSHPIFQEVTYIIINKSVLENESYVWLLKDLLKGFKGKIHCVFDKRFLRFENIISVTAPGPKDIAKSNNLFSKKFTNVGAGPKRLFLARGYAVNNKDSRSFVNAHVVERIFQKNNFMVVDPGRHDLLTQIFLFRNAECVAGLHGGAFANILFTKNPQGLKILEFFPGRYVHGAYFELCQALGSEHHSIRDAQYEMSALGASLDVFSNNKSDFSDSEILRSIKGII